MSIYADMGDDHELQIMEDNHKLQDHFDIRDCDQSYFIGIQL